VIRIAVITPTFNRPNQLFRLHRSLVETGRGVDWTHYVVDDGSAESYKLVCRECTAASGRLSYRQIDNSGPLIARNHAIDLALDEGCSYLCFVDDDDYFINEGICAIREWLHQYAGEEWFVFLSTQSRAQSFQTSNEPRAVTWFQDVVLDGVLRGDCLHVVGAHLIGDTRFSRRGRNQREWTFFLDLSMKSDRVMLIPKVVLHKDYQIGGLTQEATLNRRSSPDQIFNNIDRAFRYWQRKPLSYRLSYNLLKQVLASPVKLMLFYALRRSAPSSRRCI
jgi:glycosyltransferase involved in cell wall biosynthesis